MATKAPAAATIVCDGCGREKLENEVAGWIRTTIWLPSLVEDGDPMRVLENQDFHSTSCLRKKLDQVDKKAQPKTTTRRKSTAKKTTAKRTTTRKKS